MKSLNNARLLLWMPRALAVVFAVFISLFALGVLNERLSLWQTMLSFSMHLIPTFIVLLFLMLAWRWEWIGALGFIAPGVLYPPVAWGRFHWSTYLAISGPLFLIGVLFLASWFSRIKVTARAR